MGSARAFSSAGTALKLRVEIRVRIRVANAALTWNQADGSRQRDNTFWTAQKKQSPVEWQE